MAVCTVGFQEAVDRLRKLASVAPSSPEPKTQPTSIQNVATSTTSETPVPQRITTVLRVGMPSAGRAVLLAQQRCNRCAARTVEASTSGSPWSGKSRKLRTAQTKRAANSRSPPAFRFALRGTSRSSSSPTPRFRPLDGYRRGAPHASLTLLTDSTLTSARSDSSTSPHLAERPSP